MWGRVRVAQRRNSACGQWRQPHPLESAVGDLWVIGKRCRWPKGHPHRQTSPLPGPPGRPSLPLWPPGPWSAHTKWCN